MKDEFCENLRKGLIVMKAALYVRVSTNHQIDKDSLPFQRQELENYSKYVLGIDDFEIFEDAGYSGKNTDRPKFQEMMTRTRGGEFTHILVWKIDRVSRNLKDFTEMYDELKKCNVTFISKNEQFDTSTAMGEAMLKIILVFAELERKLTAERVYGVMLSRAEKGLWNGANVPLGYKWSEEKKFPVICDEESKIIQFIYDSYEHTKSTGEVKRRLEMEGIKTKRNGHWTTKTIADVIRNPFYIGTYRYNYRYTPHGKIRPEAEWIVVKDNHPAIISKKQFNKVNAIMDKNAHGRGSDRTLKSHIHVFKGLVSCGKCNKNYIASIDRVRSGGYSPSVYRCYNYVHNKKDYRPCNGAIGEVKLGPFVLNYVANLVKAYNFVSKNKNIDENTIEKILLSGRHFDSVVGIIHEDLRHTCHLLLNGTQAFLLDAPLESNIESDIGLTMLRIDKKKLERALERLENLYLFSEESMSEKNYLLKRQELQKKIDSINSDIKKRSREYSQNLLETDLSFIKKATQYLLAQNLFVDEIDYNEFVKVIDKHVLQDFMRNVVKNIVVEEDRTISSIEFVNGLKHRFVYRK